MAASTTAAPAAPLHPPVPPISDQIHALIVGGPAAWMPLLTAIGHGAFNLAIGVVMLLVTLWVADWTSKLARDATGRLHGRDNPEHKPDAVLQGFVSSLVKYTVVVIGLIAVLQQIGVQTTSVLAVLTAASLAIGLALQGGLSNVASGLMILLLRPYRIGDTVIIAGINGTIRGLDLFVTRVHDFDNSVVFIPNSKAFGDVIVNYSMLDTRRIVMDFGIDYDDNVDLALTLLLEAAKAEPRVVADPPPWARMTKLDDSSVTVTLRAWTAPVGYLNVRYDLIKAIKAKFEEEGLTFPYPHQVAVETRAFTGPDKARQKASLEARGGLPDSLPPKAPAAKNAQPVHRPRGKSVEIE